MMTFCAACGRLVFDDDLIVARRGRTYHVSCWKCPADGADEDRDATDEASADDPSPEPPPQTR